jgi:hypothetical protein
MINDRRPPIGCLINLIHVKDGFSSEKTRVVNHLGNYVILENGLRFHVIDDAIGENNWNLHNESINITALA